MNKDEQDQFERELERMNPAPPPPDFLARLKVARTTPKDSSPAGIESAPRWIFAAVLRRWFLPMAAATALVMAVIAWRSGIREMPEANSPTPAIGPLLSADQVEIDREWIVDFEAVAHLATGEPVRLRYREWIDDMVVRDSKQGVEIRQRIPRFEIVPVRFETD